MAKIAINGDVLAWALRDAGRSPNDLAKATDRALGEINLWLSGDAKPFKGDLERAGQLLGRSPYFFCLPRPPVEARLASAEFRRTTKLAPTRQERALELSALQWARRIQERQIRLGDTQALNLPDVRGDSPVVAAAKARSWLGWKTSEQVKAKYSKGRIFNDLRSAVEASGIAVLLHTADTTYFSGFALPHASDPLIYINRDYDVPARRIFTLAHELGHILNGQRRICYGDDRKTETWCNTFASHFLMPTVELKNYIAKRSLTFGSSEDFDPVRMVANRFKVSWESAAIRFEELKLAPPDLVANIRASRPEANIPKPDGGSGRSRPILRLEQFGARYTSTIGDAVAQGRIARLDALRILNVPSGDFGALLSMARAAER